MHNSNQNDETTYFRYVRRLDGNLEAIDLIKQAKRAVPRFVPETRQEAQLSSLSEFLRFYREIMYGLSRLDRRTWLPLLMGSTIDELAVSTQVSRQAIYARIRGKKGRGGFIRKNEYAEIWWRLKNKRNQYE